MRGLEERLAYVKEKIALQLNPDPKGGNMWSIFDDAIGQGIHDHKLGRFEVPALYRGEQLLVDGWEYGQNLEDMDNCPYCQDSSLPLCPIHG